MKHRSHRKRVGSKPVIIRFPEALVDGMKRAVRRLKINRATFIRRAVLEKLEICPPQKSENEEAP